MKLIYTILSLLIAQMAFGRAIVVKPGQKITDAIERARAGDTLVIEAGTYLEHGIIIKKKLAIIGKNLPIIDGRLNGDILIIAADSVLIKGLKIINTGTANMDDPAGIKFYDSKYCVVEDNVLDQTFFGIHFSNSSFNTIRHNTLTSKAEKEYMTGNGIHLWKCNNNTIAGNRISGHRDGIYLEFVINTVAQDNLIFENKRYGLHFMFSHDNEYLRNTFRNNGAGVAVMYTRNVTMRYNIFDQNQGPATYGLLLKDISDSKVEHNRFIGNTTAIYMEGSSRITFAHNLFRQNGSALKLMASCDNNTFEYNNFVGNTFDVSTNGSVVLNTLRYNYWDKYEGYDLNRDGIGDIPYRPISLYGTVVERIPPAVVLWRSMMVTLLDRAERALPAITPENMLDPTPKMKMND